MKNTHVFYRRINKAHGRQTLYQLIDQFLYNQTLDLSITNPVDSYTHTHSFIYSVLEIYVQSHMIDNVFDRIRKRKRYKHYIAGIENERNMGRRT